MRSARLISALTAATLIASLFLPWSGWRCPGEACLLILPFPDRSGWELLGLEDIAIVILAALLLTLAWDARGTRWLVAACGILAFALCIAGGSNLPTQPAGQEQHLLGYYVALVSAAGITLSAGAAAVAEARPFSQARATLRNP